MMNDTLKSLIDDIDALPENHPYGTVSAVRGMLVEMSGARAELSVGDRCSIDARGHKKVPAEVVGFTRDKVLMMPFVNLDGVGPGNKVDLAGAHPVLYPDVSWLGRVVNAMGEPADGKGPLKKGPKPYLIHATPPPAAMRERVAGKADLGVRAVNTFLTLCKGQRMGIFAGSGVGKSSLMAMMARHTRLDVSVLGLIGERGREAREFIEDDLGSEGMARSVVVVATSDESPLMRRQAAFVAMTVAEYFRDLKQNVLCMMDSITRFAMAQREISLSAGEPPATKGYTPSVFAPFAGTRRSRADRIGVDHGIVHRFGRRRRPQRTDRRRRTRHFGRTYRSRPLHRRTEPVSRHQPVAQHFPYDAGVQHGRRKRAGQSGARIAVHL